MNDSFTYLSVLISIVLGLGVTNSLTALAALVRQRGRVTLYWPVPIWICTLLLIHVQTWWALFGLRAVPSWSFAAFLIVLLQPISLFLMTALLVPDLAAGRTIDLKAGYFRESRWFFAILVFALLMSLAKNLILYSALPDRANVAAHAVFIAVAIVGALSKSDAVHKLLAPLSLALLGSYIGLLFLTLS